MGRRDRDSWGLGPGSLPSTWHQPVSGPAAPVMSGGRALGWTVIQGHGTCMGAQSRVPPRHRETEGKVDGGLCGRREEFVHRP